MKITVRVNGSSHDIDVDPSTPLLWVIRDHLNLTGTKFGCGIAQCGACTVHVDGESVRSCQLPIADVGDSEIVTIEGLSSDGTHPLQKLWVELNVAQCGYCQTGVLMSAAALLRREPNPTDADIDAYVDNICRCGTYPRIRKAIHQAALKINSGKEGT